MALPTEQIYSEMSHAYSAFNRDLFGNKLPPCLITVQRQSRTYGFFPAKSWNNQVGAITDEIILNPVQLEAYSAQDILSMLAHEMTHLWQYHFGKPSRTGYHNREWANQLTAIGLQPSDTGEPGGKRTGQRMSHYVIEGGLFLQASRVLIGQGIGTSWCEWTGTDTAQPRGRQKTSSRSKYSCIVCGLNAWAKPNASLYCGTCELELLPST